MTRAWIWLLAAGAVLFCAILVSQGIGTVFARLELAGYGLLLVTLFHIVPLALDAGSIWVLCERAETHCSLRDSLLVRWVGESGNSLMPAGQLGGPVLMVRQLLHRGMRSEDAIGIITVSSTLQSLAQIAFALMGAVVLSQHAGEWFQHSLRTPLLIAGAALVLTVVPFYLLQRRGLFAKSVRMFAKLLGRNDWSQLLGQAISADIAVQAIYARPARASASFLLSLVGWIVGTAEVYLILLLLRHPVSWADALLLESLGQAFRAAGFAIPGSLGVQEGGYLLLGPLAGLTSDLALALSLAKRAREIVLAVPGLLYLYVSERSWRRRAVIV